MCDYCEKGKKIPYSPMFTIAMGEHLSEYEGQIYDGIFDDMNIGVSGNQMRMEAKKFSATSVINYCPMCGRALDVPRTKSIDEMGWADLLK